MTGDRYQQHAHELASAFGVTLLFDPTLEHECAWSNPPQMMVVARPVADDTTYAVVLHEIGHCVAPFGTLHREKKAARNKREFVNLHLVEEESAWAWAEHYALEWTAGMEAVKEFGLQTYRARLAEGKSKLPHARSCSVKPNQMGRVMSSVARPVERGIGCRLEPRRAAVTVMCSFSRRIHNA